MSAPTAVLQLDLDRLARLRRDIHQHPETAYEEHRTSALIAERLRAMGVAVHTGMAETAVIGTLQRGTGPAIALRADMDALHMHEANEFDHRSQHGGKMHGCGHDGHVAMLLGAAEHLAATDSFRGTVHFIFQPAEENEGGAKRMVTEGLFQQFPVTAVYGMHNWPGLPVGQFATCVGPIMAAYDNFEITLTGVGAHAAMPHQGRDAIVAAAELVGALQSLVARRLDPQDAAVVSVTQMHAGDTWNVLPAQAVLRGTTRYFSDSAQARIETGVRELAGGVAAAHGVAAEVDYQCLYPATVNSAAETANAIAAAAAVVGSSNVNGNVTASLSSEDFACMLQVTRGCYVWIGNGPGEGGCLLHNPLYDFNDGILELGARYWVSLVEQQLPA